MGILKFLTLGGLALTVVNAVFAAMSMPNSEAVVANAGRAIMFLALAALFGALWLAAAGIRRMTRKV